MQISSTNSIHGPQAINAPHRATSAKPTGSAQATGNVDQLEISSQADMVSRARDLPPVRQELVDRIRGQIASGAYETPEKLDIALGHLLDEIS